MKNIASFLAWKYLTYKHKDANISFMIKICFVGIFIGSFALMLALMITNGLEKTIHEKMQGINAQVVIYSPGNRLDYESITNVLKKDFPRDLTAVSGYSIKQAIFEHNNLQSILFLKGIDPEAESNVTNVFSKITTPYNVDAGMFKELLQDNSIIIGHKMAREHNLSVGQEITIMLPEAGGKKKILLNKRKVIIAGIFNIGLEEYDNNFAFVNLESLNDWFDEQGVDHITLKLSNLPTIKDIMYQTSSVKTFFKRVYRLVKYKIQLLFSGYDHEHVIIKKLQYRLPHLMVLSWKDQYPALVSSLKLEKYGAFLILALITLVASMNMISLLFMQIQNKQRDIAIFKTMGMHNSMIRSIFLRIGMGITLSASLCGLALAAIAGSLIETYKCIPVPDVYYVSHLPARMDFEIFFVVFVATMLLGFLATWLPARRCKQINIPSVLRHQ